jgi:hypothetical protein
MIGRDSSVKSGKVKRDGAALSVDAEAANEKAFC